MTASENEGQSALIQLRAFLAQHELGMNDRLPPERELCGTLGVTRTALRNALSTLEAEGHLWRRVGKGTFVGAQPIDDFSDIAAITSRTNPAEVMSARRLIEAELARVAALNATAADIEEMRVCLAKSKAAANWRQYESWDNRLHRVIAQATGSTLLLALFDTLNAVRRAVVWGRLRPNKPKPAANHHSFTEHAEIVTAIAERDMDRAADAMRRHLESVERNLLRPRVAAE